MPEDPAEQPKSPAPEAADTPATPANSAAGETAAPRAEAGAPQADALPDGTKPTILTTGKTLKSLPPTFGKATLGSIYRRADITTTIITFVGAIITAAIILGGYTYFTKSNPKPPTVLKPSQLDAADLAKLKTFFEGNNAGTPAEILNISSSSFFRNRVAIGNDLKVTGSLDIDGPTTFGELRVDKTANFGITNIRGQLTVTAPTTINASTTVGGNLSVSGTGSFGGSLSAGSIQVSNLTVTGSLNIPGHLSATGAAPTASTGSEAGPGSGASVTGTDTAGTVTITTGTNPAIGLLVNVTFRAPYSKVPHVLITPIGAGAGRLEAYVQKTTTGFTIGVNVDPANATAYSFDYWVVQ